jgi:hypothetical protein
MFSENPTYLIVGCESSFSCRFQAAIYSGKLFRRRVILPDSKRGINFKCDLCKLSLRVFRPPLHALQNVSEDLDRHGSTIANRPFFLTAGIIRPPLKQ